MENEDKLKYSFEVYEDYALLHGWLDNNVFILLLDLCVKEGFTNIPSFEGGIKLVRK